MKTIEQNLSAVNNAEYQPNDVDVKSEISDVKTQVLALIERKNILNEILPWEVLKNSQTILNQWRMELELGWLLNRFSTKEVANNSTTGAPGSGMWLTTKLGWPFIDTRLAA